MDPDLFRDFFDFLSLKNYGNVPSKVICRKKIFVGVVSVVGVLRSIMTIAGSGFASESVSIRHRHESTDPDPSVPHSSAFFV
jgi:hypothetical protein